MRRAAYQIDGVTRGALKHTPVNLQRHRLELRQGRSTNVQKLNATLRDYRYRFRDQECQQPELCSQMKDGLVVRGLLS